MDHIYCTFHVCRFLLSLEEQPSITNLDVSAQRVFLDLSCITSRQRSTSSVPRTIWLCYLIAPHMIQMRTRSHAGRGLRYEKRSQSSSLSHSGGFADVRNALRIPVLLGKKGSEESIVEGTAIQSGLPRIHAPTYSPELSSSSLLKSQESDMRGRIRYQ